ncbi:MULTISPECIES: bifunctional sugar-1-phosphate nucleotidylyltransferase/acetyltransferase [unclassified Haladaptatus]|uniref:bifunctional sugar-1-phosphate nucleotidylyltransferase/acetyltransferase n=1 Tax=unclassified Haladaptatus TaxID=2622732 RepID=UPI00209BC9D9|nr:MULTISPECIES: bifunctional sugar-1-phosphate nucleotidylyltransferase/acetyltransferase [unclassified Haladaptatus]MCO8247062.1 sugar phosphate nucleotidyltransferase [Haladaptatus sp. AB643]MCO8256671.1 sugar phosphate nucleotidyltransferase [Haladaptatus sp. AB618]
MQAIVLAAGEGTRMRPLSASCPKPMLPVAEEPLVAHTARAAVEAGAEELVLVVGYEADTVREYFGAEYAGIPVKYSVQEEQRGTADAVRAAREHIDGPFAVLNGDNLYDTAAVKQLLSNGPGVGTYRVDDPSNYGVISTDGDRATGIVEKPDDPPTDLANTGAYVFPEEARDWLDVGESERGEFEITDVVERVIEEYDVTAVEVKRWLDVGRPWELLEANEWKIGELERDISGDVSDGATITGDVVVEEGATVKSGVVIEGPALIRSDATIGPNAYIRGATLVDEGAKVGHSVEVKNSVLSPGATVGHLSYVGDSVLGRDVNFGAGTNVANLRHDGKSVKHTVKGDRVSTGRRKFGVVVGDNVKTGINTSLYPGVTLSEGAMTLPNEEVSRDK